ncbi:hypothetical protein HFN57_32165 [Rhizobium leguminosarum]|uniref:hypothetical protein n=2 Tax=Rhizobium leguminosarum TaxID=384 RepID=UPI0014427A80|nr:hypothetical protein [Rhizobium leguminosarum]MBY5841094.1 hypothetical protein [Rhizobium leguminosarum]NKM80413.1 hypothetical protein [Rhizobium leguminosarum bv. viciae]
MVVNGIWFSITFVSLRMSLLATLFGLGVGFLAMLIIEALNVGSDYLPALAIDYWTYTDFVLSFLSDSQHRR